MENRSRSLAAVAALISWMALALQADLTVGLAISTSSSIPAALWEWFGYFTISTNLLVATVLSASALGPIGRISCLLVRPGVQSMTAMSILIVGIIYNFLLRGLWHPQGWGLVADITLHDVMPLLFLLHWWINVPKAELRVRQIATWQLYPIAYFTYALLRGALNGWYPYPFLDVTTLGYARVVINALVILLAFLAIALMLVKSGHWQEHRSLARRLAAT